MLMLLSFVYIIIEILSEMIFFISFIDDFIFSMLEYIIGMLFYFIFS